MARRPPQTLADYLVVGLTPALIMFLVGSLMWFLVEVFYGGEYKFRTLWVMSFFVLGIVGVSRIAMEEGFHYASLFGGPLAAALMLVLPPFGWPLLALVWWAAHKLTWDCTLIDDTQDASGQGLLEQMGLDSAAVSPTTPANPGGSAAVEPTAPGANAAPTNPWWHRLLEPDRRPHAPGVWVVYFSLAALPLFGIGGWFVTAPVERAFFGLLVIYVASGMGLLLTTSFLGLRRYLRQRRLEMPMEMTSTWIIVGVIMILAMLLVATILPRPGREHSLSELPFAIKSAAQRASRFGWGSEGARDEAAKDAAKTAARKGQQTDRQGGQKPADGSDSKQADSGKQSKGSAQGKAADESASGKSAGGGKGSGSQGDSKGKSSDGGQQGGQGKASQADKSSNKAEPGRKGDQSQADQQSSDSKEPKSQPSAEKGHASPGESQQPPPQPESTTSSPRQTMSQIVPHLTASLGTIIRWLFYAALIIGGIAAAFIYREQLLEAWHKLLAELNELWRQWFGQPKTVADTATDVAAPPPYVRRFADFSDPFLTGDAQRMSWPQIVRYSFAALEAWARDQGSPRAPGQTPLEFALAITRSEPAVAGQVQALANGYGQLAYAPRSGATGSLESLKELWAFMRSTASVTPVASQ